MLSHRLRCVLAVTTLVALVLCLQTFALAAPDRILSIDVTGARTVPIKTILEAVRPLASVGRVPRDLPTLVTKMQAKILQLGYFDAVEVDPERSDDGLRLKVSVRERPRVREITFAGNSLLTDKQILGAMHTQRGIFLDPAVLKRDVQRIANAYKDAGLFGVVTGATADAQGNLTVKIHEARVSRVAFTGLAIVRADEALQTSGLKVGEPLRTDAIDAAVRALNATGWFKDVKVTLASDEDEKVLGAVVEFQLEELPGVLPDRVGVPKENIDVAALRADVHGIRVNVTYEAELSINRDLLELGEDVPAVVKARGEAALAADATPQAVLQYAKVLDAVGRDAEASDQYRRAAGLFAQLVGQSPDDVAAQVALGVCLNEAGEPLKACEVLRAAAALAPDRWEPRVRFAEAASAHIRRQFAQFISRDAMKRQGKATVGRSSVVAMLEIIPWEKTRQLALGALDAPPGEPDALILLAREAVSNIERASALAPQEPELLSAIVGIVLGHTLTAATILGDGSALRTAVVEDGQTFFDSRRAVVEGDLVLSLSEVCFSGFRAVLTLMGAADPKASEEKATAEVRALAEKLTGIGEKWPAAVRSTAKMLGMLQILAERHDLATATLEQAIAENPFARDQYNALMGIAYQKDDWPAIAQIVRRRMKYSEEAEDHVLLGKVAGLMDEPDQALGHFRDAAEKFPDDALGYFATAGWLLNAGKDDKEAASLVQKGLALSPRSGYGNGLRCVLAIIEGNSEEAAAALKAALAGEPEDELANDLRNKYFQQ